MPSGEVSTAGVFGPYLQHVRMEAGAGGPAVCSQASTVRPGVTEALPLRMGTGYRGQTWRENQELPGLLPGFNPLSICAEAGGPCEHLHRR